jgi:hypothetical protein
MAVQANTPTYPVSSCSLSERVAPGCDENASCAGFRCQNGLSRSALVTCAKGAAASVGSQRDSGRGELVACASLESPQSSGTMSSTEKMPREDTLFEQDMDVASRSNDLGGLAQSKTDQGIAQTAVVARVPEKGGEVYLGRGSTRRDSVGSAAQDDHRASARGGDGPLGQVSYKSLERGRHGHDVQRMGRRSSAGPPGGGRDHDGSSGSDEHVEMLEWINRVEEAESRSALDSDNALELLQLVPRISFPPVQRVWVRSKLFLENSLAKNKGQPSGTPVGTVPGEGPLTVHAADTENSGSSVTGLTDSSAAEESAAQVGSAMATEGPAATVEAACMSDGHSFKDDVGTQADGAGDSLQKGAVGTLDGQIGIGEQAGEQEPMEKVFRGGEEQMAGNASEASSATEVPQPPTSANNAAEAGERLPSVIPDVGGATHLQNTTSSNMEGSEEKAAVHKVESGAEDEAEVARGDASHEEQAIAARGKSASALTGSLRLLYKILTSHPFTKGSWMDSWESFFNYKRPSLLHLLAL